LLLFISLVVSFVAFVVVVVVDPFVSADVSFLDDVGKIFVRFSPVFAVDLRMFAINAAEPVKGTFSGGGGAVFSSFIFFFSAVVSVAVLLLLVTSILGRSCDRWSSSSFALFLVVSSHLPPLATARYRPHPTPPASAVGTITKGKNKRRKKPTAHAVIIRDGTTITRWTFRCRHKYSYQKAVVVVVVVVVVVFFGTPLSIVLVLVGMSSLTSTMDNLFFQVCTTNLFSLASLALFTRRRRPKKTLFKSLLPLLLLLLLLLLPSVKVVLFVFSCWKRGERGRDLPPSLCVSKMSFLSSFFLLLFPKKSRPSV
jgi:hypothetical protein